MFKRRVGITQKVMKHTSYNETMDCLDINWAKLLIPLEILPIPLPLMPTNSVNDIWKILKLDGLILSGGNTLADYADTSDKPESISIERDIYEKTLLKAALSTKTPVLGVCRGLQVINVYYNGQLEKVKGHAGTRHLLIPENSINDFEIPSEVNSFHDCVVPRKHLGKNLISLAHDAEDNIEAFYHPKDKVLGIMWHPERVPIPLNSDCKLIKNHFGI
jgi:N5-(cytidine 5'-diphosphoramidyl)-L-glutamine hydrolase